MRLFLLTLALAFSIFALTACSSESALTPTATMNSQVAAMQKNDLPAMRSNLSQGTLQMIEKAAQAQKVTSDEVLASMSRKANAANKDALIETRNEQINGAAATLELKNPVTGGWDKIPFVKEDGRWKIALDKFMEDVLKQTDEPAEPAKN